MVEFQLAHGHTAGALLGSQLTHWVVTVVGAEREVVLLGAVLLCGGAKPGVKLRSSGV